MNIQRLLKKLDKSSVDNKRQLLTAQAAYKLKTSESIGTLNSLADQNQRSFVISDAFTPQNRKIQENTLSANSKLDQELVNIQKMKNLYESRQNRNRVRNKSFDRNSTSGKKSSQKHLLRPSNTPSFNKIQKPKVVHQNDSACKNLYTQQILQNSQASQISQTNPINNMKSGDRKNYFQYPESSLHVEQHDNEPYEQQPSYNQQSLSQIANISQDLPHDTSIQKIQKKVKQTLQQTWQHQNNPPLHCETNRLKNSVHHSSCSCQNSCFSKQDFTSMMANFEKKIESLTKRVDQLEDQNKEIKLNQQEILKENLKYKQDLQATNEEKQKAQQDLKKQMEEKQQLQILLKDVLYKREREKLQSSKQNTFRENQKSDKRINNFSFVQSQSTSQLKPTRISSNSSTQNRQSESKMKVQNLLQKLHIKVDRA